MHLVNKKRKKAPKSSNKKKKKTSQNKDLLIFTTFIIFILVITLVFYYFQSQNSNQDSIALVNDQEITKQDLDFWYKLSVTSAYKDVITKLNFLQTSLIPQEILIQEADKENIKVTKEEVEKLIGLYAIENGLTLDEFEKQLKDQDITINDIRNSFKSRIKIMKLLEIKNLTIYGEEESTFYYDSEIIEKYLDEVTEDSEIEIFYEKILSSELKNFVDTGDGICRDEKPIIRFYTTSTCETCKESIVLFQDSVIELIGDEIVQARHWSLDTGDNLLSLKKEKGVPKKEVDLFKKYSPDNKVPLLVLGCKYKRIGSFTEKELVEFHDILTYLIS